MEILKHRSYLELWISAEIHFIISLVHAYNTYYDGYALMHYNIVRIS